MASVATPAKTQLPDRQAHRTKRLLNAMAKHLEIVCFIFAVLFAIISRYSRSSGGASRLFMPQPTPRVFFSQSTTILDFPYGNIEDVADILNEENIIAVMYYAPWCARSNRARAQFDKAAQWFAGDILFIGVNCWYSLGSCRKQNNFVSFPVIYVYCKGRDGYRYSGAVQADRLVDFVRRLLYPLSRIVSVQQYQQFAATHDNVVIGYFDFHASPQPPGYYQFYLTAQRVMEKDQKNRVPFGIITSPQLARYASLNHTHHVLLARHSNTTLFYPEAANFTSSAITQWVMTNRSMSRCKWHLPAEIKSQALSKEVNAGPALLLFTPYKPMAPIDPHFITLREISMDYFNCDNDTSIHTAIDTSRKQLVSSIVEHQELLEECQTLLKNRKKSTNNKDTPQQHTFKCCSSISSHSSQHSFQRTSCDVCVNFRTLSLKVPSPSCNHLNTLTFLSGGTLQLDLTNMCTAHGVYYNPWEYMTVCCDGSQTLNKNYNIKNYAYESSAFGESSPGSSETMTVPHTSLKHKCQRLRKLKNNGWTLGGNSLSLQQFGPREPSSIARAKNFTGLGCRTNRTLNFLAMDSRSSYPFAERLGVSLGKSLNKTVAVIFDKQDEGSYILNSTATKDTLVSLILNYTEGVLKRNRRSSTATNTLMCDSHHRDMCIYEVTSYTLDSIVMDVDTDVVLLHYAPWCGFCTTLAHTFLNLAKYFRTAQNLRFARINGDTNDLPWNMQSFNYPTIQLFPAYRKSDSVIFPEHLDKTLPNLVQFVLQHSARPLRLQTGLSICTRTCLDHNRNRTVARIHTLYTHIRALKQKIARFKDKLNECRTLSQTTKNILNEADYRDKNLRSKLETKALSLQSSIERLKKDLMLKELQIASARKLHKSLLSSKGKYLEQHKLVAISKDHTVFQSKVEKTNKERTEHQKQHLAKIKDKVIHEEL